MTEGKPKAFLSYVRDVNDQDRGYLSRFRALLSDEVRVQTGEDFPIFQDLEDIHWGQNWKHRIEESLQEVTLLIPILTPGFFKSPACRYEVELFLERERRLARRNLVLPIHYVDCPVLQDSVRRENDPVASEMACRQWVDWRKLRFKHLDSEVAREALAELATHLLAALDAPASDSVVQVPSPPRELPRRGVAAIDPFNHFCVNREIDDQEKFVGRRAELERAVGVLRSPGAACVIFGFAGVGKSSLALQVANIAAGQHVELLRKLSLEGLRPEGGFKRPVAYYSCRERIDTDLNATLLSVLIDSASQFCLGILLGEKPVQDELRRESNAPVLAALDEVRRNGHDDEGRRRAPELFRNVAALISRAYQQQPLVLIIDEFDRVADKRGFASMIKNDRFVTFIIVGTAVDVRPLIQEHQSVQRQLAGGQVRVHPLTATEVNAVLRVEETRAAGAFRFAPSAVAAIVNSSRGFPFYVHLFGRYALRHALEHHATAQPCLLEIGRDDVVGGMHEALRDQQDLHDRYLDIVRGKWEREAMLKLFACRDEDDVPLTNVYPHAEKLSIPNYARQTESLIRSSILIATGHNHYMFADARLKVYARLVDPMCEATRRVLDHLSSRISDPRAEGWMFAPVV